jgi:general secretion pathway protein F
MPALEYKGFDAKGKPVSGVREADSARALRGLRKRQGVFVSEVREAGERSAPSAGKGLRAEVDFKTLLDRVRPQDIAMMTRQLGTLLKAGIPLVESLHALIEQSTSIKLSRALAEVRTKVNEGTSLGDALADHPRFFSHLYVNMVRAGEAAGNLEQVVLRLADFMDGQVRLRSKVSSAMMYPAIMG